MATGNITGMGAPQYAPAATAVGTGAAGAAGAGGGESGNQMALQLQASIQDQQQRTMISNQMNSDAQEWNNTAHMLQETKMTCLKNQHDICLETVRNMKVSQ